MARHNDKTLNRAIKAILQCLADYVAAGVVVNFVQTLCYDSGYVSVEGDAFKTAYRKLHHEKDANGDTILKKLVIGNDSMKNYELTERGKRELPAPSGCKNQTKRDRLLSMILRYPSSALLRTANGINLTRLPRAKVELIYDALLPGYDDNGNLKNECTPKGKKELAVIGGYTNTGGKVSAIVRQLLNRMDDLGMLAGNDKVSSCVTLKDAMVLRNE